MPLGNFIRKRRKELGLTLDRVANDTGFSKPYLSTVETGKVKNPPSDNLLKKLEDVLELQAGLLVHIAHMERMPADLRQDYETAEAENRKLKSLVKNLMQSPSPEPLLEQFQQENKLDGDTQGGSGTLIPIINRVEAGYPADYDDLGYPTGIADDYVRCPDIYDPNAFAVRVIGDSMEPKFFEGDIVIFSPSSEVRNGDDCFVRFKEPHETTFKRVFFENGDQLRLQPRNDQYPPMLVEPGRVNGLYRAVRRIQEL